MAIVKNEAAEQWNKFVVEHGPKSGAFLQSFEWGTFQETIGRKALRFDIKGNQLKPVIASPPHQSKHGAGHAPAVAISSVANSEVAARHLVASNDGVDGLVQIIKIPLPFGRSYLYVPRGPILKISNDKFLISNLGKLLENLAKKENAIFTKIELPIGQQSFEKINIQPTTYNLQTRSMQPRDTLILDLSKSEGELLREMREKTRYNIRLAERKGVEVRWSREETSEKDLEIFWQLAEKTAKRDKFSYHPKEYYKEILYISRNQESGIRNQGKENLLVKLIVAEKDGEPLAASIITCFGKTVTYLHGASDHKHRALMAPHLLQWRAIQEAKRLEYKYYDFWGVAPPKPVIARPEAVAISSVASSEIAARPPVARNDVSHHWSGITRFKLGFGGEQIHYAPTLDLPMSKFWYNLYRLARFVRQ